MAVTAQSPQLQRRTVASLAEQARTVSELLAALDEDEFRRPVPGLVDPGGLTDQSVATLVAWMVVCESHLVEALSAATSARPVSLADYVSGDRPVRHRKRQLARELADHASGRSLATQFRQQMTEIHALVSEPTVPGVVLVGSQPLRTLDLLRLTTVELFFVIDDLGRSLPGRAIEWTRGATADATRALTEIMAHRHPGRSIELRVPPFAAVQCGTGDDPTHTRGTPPNVVEIDPQTFVRLAHGRARFGDELARGAVSASGTRSDLSSWFPLIG